MLFLIFCIFCVIFGGALAGYCLAIPPLIVLSMAFVALCVFSLKRRHRSTSSGMAALGDGFAILLGSGGSLLLLASMWTTAIIVRINDLPGVPWSSFQHWFVR